MSSRWLTPEEVQKKRRKKKLLLNLSIPIIGGLIGALVTFLLANL